MHDYFGLHLQLKDKNNRDMFYKSILLESPPGIVMSDINRDHPLCEQLGEEAVIHLQRLMAKMSDILEEYSRNLNEQK